MTESTVLDVLLGGIIILVALIGYWQGIVRGLLVLGGALVGSELSLWWSDDIGDNLAKLLPFNSDTGRFVASTVLIVGSALVLGVAPGNLAFRPASGLRERLGGIGVSLVSALLIIGLFIRYFTIHMAARADEALSDTHLALALWEHFDWFVLVSVISGVGLLVLLWVLGAPGPVSQSSYARASAANSWTSISRSAKAEASGGSQSQHRPVNRVPPASNSDYAVYGKSDGGGPMEIQRATAAPQQFSSPEGDQSSSGASAADSQGPAFERQYAPVASTLAFTDDDNASDDQPAKGICPNCGMLLSSGDQFCPDCGHPVD